MLNKDLCAKKHKDNTACKLSLGFVLCAEYVADLYAVQSKKVDKLKIAIDEFCIHHDYRRVGTPLSDDARDSLKVAQKTLYGDNK